MLNISCNKYAYLTEFRPNVLQYLKDKKELKIKYDGSSDARLIGYSDPDWGENVTIHTAHGLLFLYLTLTPLRSHTYSTPFSHLLHSVLTLTPLRSHTYSTLTHNSHAYDSSFSHSLHSDS